MRTFRFILLILVTLAAIGAAVLLTIDGNLSRIIGRTAFSSGERLFPYTREEMNEVSWMRINCMGDVAEFRLSLIHISEPTRLGMISYAVFCLKK